MPPPPPRKPPAPVAQAKPSESFIGNDASTMMTEETFEEFEARMKSNEDEAEQEPGADNAGVESPDADLGE